MTDQILSRRPGDPWPSGPVDALQHHLIQMLDEIDYGLLLLGDDLHVLHANKSARRSLDERHPLQISAQEVQARYRCDAAPLRDALSGASLRGLRRLLRIGEGAQRASLAVVPLVPMTGCSRQAVLLLLGKRRVCEDLSVDWFARAHRLTGAESQVLKCLCTGARPAEVARQQGVALSTVRSQIGSIRTKTGADGIRDLVRQISVLPPLVSTVQGLDPQHSAEDLMATAADG